jgi:hypothetical protein
MCTSLCCATVPCPTCLTRTSCAVPSPVSCPTCHTRRARGDLAGLIPQAVKPCLIPPVLCHLPCHSHLAHKTHPASAGRSRAKSVSCWRIEGPLCHRCATCATLRWHTCHRLFVQFPCLIPQAVKPVQAARGRTCAESPEGRTTSQESPGGDSMTAKLSPAAERMRVHRRRRRNGYRSVSLFLHETEIEFRCFR